MTATPQVGNQIQIVIATYRLIYEVPKGHKIGIPILLRGNIFNF